MLLYISDNNTIFVNFPSISTEFKEAGLMFHYTEEMQLINSLLCQKLAYTHTAEVVERGLPPRHEQTAVNYQNHKDLRNLYNYDSQVFSLKCASDYSLHSGNKPTFKITFSLYFSALSLKAN